MQSRTLFAAALAGSLAGCAFQAPVAYPGLEGTQWQLVSVTGRTLTLPETPPIELRFQDSRVNFHGCNALSGRYSEKASAGRSRVPRPLTTTLRHQARSRHTLARCTRERRASNTQVRAAVPAALSTRSGSRAQSSVPHHAPIPGRPCPSGWRCHCHGHAGHSRGRRPANTSNTLGPDRALLSSCRRFQVDHGLRLYRHRPDAPRSHAAGTAVAISRRHFHRSEP